MFAAPTDDAVGALAEIRGILAEEFGGNEAAMARDLGIPQSSFIRAIHPEEHPAAKQGTVNTRVLDVLKKVRGRKSGNQIPNGTVRETSPPLPRLADTISEEMRRAEAEDGPVPEDAYRYAHLIPAASVWDYELVDPETGEVRMAVNVRFMVTGKPIRRAMSAARSGALTDPAAAYSTEAG